MMTLKKSEWIRVTLTPVQSKERNFHLFDMGTQGGVGGGGGGVVYYIKETWFPSMGNFYLSRTYWSCNYYFSEYEQ